MLDLVHPRLSIALSAIAVLLTPISSLAQTQERESLTKPVFRVENQPANSHLIAVTATAPATPSLGKSNVVPATVQPAYADRTTQVAPTTAISQEEVEQQSGSVQTTTLPAKPQDIEKLAALENQNNSDTKPAVEKSEAKKTLDLATRDAKIALENIKKNIRDYQCDFIKRERIGGRLRSTEQIKLKVRNGRPATANCKCSHFSVYMKFLGPRDCKNREVLFADGQNNGKMLVREGGTRGRFMPSVWLSPEGTFATSSSRYPITQVGLQRLTERLIESAEANPCINNECKVKYINGAKVDGRVCSYLEVIRPTKKVNEPLGPNNIYLAQVFLDQELKLPIRYAAYDWPSAPGGKPRLVEEYTYRNIELNVGLCDKDFSSKNPKYKF